MEETVSTDTIADMAAPPAGRSERATGRPRILALFVRVSAGLVVTALATLVVLQANTARHDSSRKDGRAAAVAAARAEVTTLTSVTSTGAAGQIKQLLDGATASFKDNLSQFATSLQSALNQDKVTSTGTVAESGVVSQSGDTVVVIIAVTATVKNSSVPAGEPRNYRLKVTMQKSGSRWLVSDLAFVP